MFNFVSEEEAKEELEDLRNGIYSDEVALEVCFWLINAVDNKKTTWENLGLAGKEELRSFLKESFHKYI